MPSKNLTPEHKSLLRSIEGANQEAEAAARDAAETKARLEALILKAMARGVQVAAICRATQGKTPKTIQAMAARAKAVEERSKSAS